MMRSCFSKNTVPLGVSVTAAQLKGVSLQTMNKFGSIFLGVILFVLGVSVWYEPRFLSSKYQMTVDLTNVRIPFAIISCTVGILLVITSLRRNSKTSHKP